MKKGLTLEEAIKALHGGLSVNEGSKKAVKGKRKVRESVEETYFKDIKKLEQMYDCTFSISDNAIEGYRGHTTLFFKEFKNEEELKDIIKKLLDEEVEYGDGEDFDEDSFELNESEKKLKEEFDDFPKLTNLAKGEVFTAYFGNHESCDFSYDSKKDTLIQKYYDPADTFKFKNIKTQTDFEKVVKDELGDGKITWEKKRFSQNESKKKLKEGAATEVKIPSPYNKYYQVAEVDKINAGYDVGDQIEGYDIRILAYLDAKPEYEDILKEPYAVLTDDEDYPVCVIVGDRVYDVSIESLPEE